MCYVPLTSIFTSSPLTDTDGSFFDLSADEERFLLSTEEDRPLPDPARCLLFMEPCLKYVTFS